MNVTPGGSGNVKIGGTTYLSPVTVADNSLQWFEAIPADGYEFIRWGIVDSTGNYSSSTNPTQYQITCDTTVTATLQEVVNEPPVADAGDDQNVVEGATVALDGSGSSDPDGDIATYQWTQTGGTNVALSSPTAVSPTFTAPTVNAGGAALTFELTVMDSTGLDDSDTCTVNILDTEGPPVADAGDDQNVVEGATVTLDGSGSSDPDGDIATYQWTQTGGTNVALSSPTAVSPTFTAPAFNAGGAALTFELTVTDSTGLDDSDTCTVTVLDTEQPPVADAGEDQEVDEGATVTLDGSDSSDPDGTIVAYQWTQTGDTTVTLSNSAAAQPTFVTPPVGAGATDVTFDLKVTDNDGLQSTDQVSITVSDNNIVGFPADVTTFKASTNEDMGVKAGTGAHITSLQAVSPDTIVGDPEGKPDNLIYGLINMKITVNTAGGTVEVTLYLPEAAPEDYTCYKYLPSNGEWIDFSAHAVFNAARDQIVLTLTDGGDGDDDGVANGVIIDPTGLGTDPGSPSVSIDGGGGGGGCFISTVEP
ncbi:MAG: PKD domain-containing protein [Syntrophales bacterium]|nr:PKD domain-containing protein [Syntrophales bacterium]